MPVDEAKKMPTEGRSRTLLESFQFSAFCRRVAILGAGSPTVGPRRLEQFWLWLPSEL
jgi:hypothetical protein